MTLEEFKEDYNYSPIELEDMARLILRELDEDHELYLAASQYNHYACRFRQFLELNGVERG